MRLRYRLSFLIGLAALIPLGFTGIASTRIANRHHVEQTRELYGKQAEGLALLALTWLEEQLRGLSVAVDLFPVQNLGPDEREGLLRFIYRQFDSVNIVVLRDSNGVPLANTVAVSERTELPSEAHQIVDSARLNAFLERLPQKEALDRGLARGPAYIPPGAPAPVVPVAIRTQGPDPVVLGVELSLSQLVEHFLNQGSAGGALVLV
ncbi:MAG: hypothetical protein VX519_01030, partial [Myxococcota bacterium]|nr:hypothetical protein [Myxococcota bacterium]